MPEDLGGLFSDESPKPETYYDALRTLANYYKIDQQLELERETMFYAQLARALLKEGCGVDPFDIWASAVADAALCVLETDLRRLIDKHRKHRTGRLINGKDPGKKQAEAAQTAIFAAALGWEYCGIPRRKRGRPFQSSAARGELRDEFMKAKLDFSRPWRESKLKLDAYKSESEWQLPAGPKRVERKKKMNHLVGRNFEKARALYRRIQAERQREEEYLNRVFTDDLP